MRKVALIVLFTSVVYCNMSAQSDQNYQEKRNEMVRGQIAGRGITDENVLDAMRKVPRHLFMPEQVRDEAYEDQPVPIGFSQTISQPYIVAYMTDTLGVGPKDRVLEIGTGSGYQAAVLAEIADSVFSIEIVEPLCEQARETIDSLGYDNCEIRCGDGYNGWLEKAPFDAIIITAAPPTIPEPLIEQLAVGGRMVVPVGRYVQYLMRYTKNADGTLDEERLLSVRFVPMTGEILDER